MVYTFTSVPPVQTQTQFNADRQAIADAINAITSTGIGAGPYSFLVRKSGAVYEAYNSQAALVYGGSGNAGGVDGADNNAVIQAALDNLTVGARTHKAKLVLNGDLGEVHDLQVSSFTSIEGADAKLTVPANEDFIFKDKNAGTTDVKINGIRFEAITAGRSAEPIAIDLSLNGQANDVKIQNCGFENFIYTAGTPSGIRGNYKNLDVSHNKFESLSGTGNSYQTYLTTGCDDVRIHNNRYYTTFAGNCIFGEGAYTQIYGNHFEAAAGADGLDLGAVDHIEGDFFEVHNNTFIRFPAVGVLIGGNNLGGILKYVDIHNNLFYRCGYGTFAGKIGAVGTGGVFACTRVKIEHNIMDDCASGIGHVGSSGNNIANVVELSNNWVEYCVYPIAMYGNNFNVRMVENIFRNNTNPAFVQTGTLWAKLNEGYVTENGGTGSIASGTTADVIAHGCSYTPVLADIIITLGENPTNTPGAIWVDTIGAANFTVNCENDPGASNLDFSWAIRKV